MYVNINMFILFMCLYISMTQRHVNCLTAGRGEEESGGDSVWDSSHPAHEGAVRSAPLQLSDTIIHRGLYFSEVRFLDGKYYARETSGHARPISNVKQFSLHIGSKIPETARTPPMRVLSGLPLSDPSF